MVRIYAVLESREVTHGMAVSLITDKGSFIYARKMVGVSRIEAEGSVLKAAVKLLSAYGKYAPTILRIDPDLQDRMEDLYPNINCGIIRSDTAELLSEQAYHFAMEALDYTDGDTHCIKGD